MRDYNGFITAGFTGYGIPPEILQVVRNWVIEECGEGFWGVEDDLGFAELADITSFDQAMKILKENIEWQQVEGKRTYNKFLKDAGGRVGKGFYRLALKAYYLFDIKT
jgi:hypothetical protein